MSSTLLFVFLAGPATGHAGIQHADSSRPGMARTAEKPAVESGREVGRLLLKVYDPKPPPFSDLVRSLARLGPAATEELAAIYVGAVEPPHPPENAALAPQDPLDTTERPAMQDVVLAALKALPPGEVVAAIRTRAMGTVPIQVRANGFRALGAVGTTRGLEALLDSAKELSDFELALPGLHEPAADAVASILSGADHGWGELEKRSTKLPPGLERIVVRGIARSGSPRGFAVLMRFLARPGADKAFLFESIDELSLKSAPWIEEHDRAEIRSALESTDPETRCRVAFVLARAQDAASVPAFIEFLDSEDGRLRNAGLWALETMSGFSLPGESARWREWHAEQLKWRAESLPSLRLQVRSSEPTAAFEAIAELCRRPLFRHELGEDIAYPLAQGPTELALAACAGLAELRSLFAVPALVEALRRPEESVREAAGAALRVITGRDHPADFEAWFAEIRP
ncbi:MAG: HEAT repeat domain-containing protein [Planctomycetota bacterium]